MFHKQISCAFQLCSNVSGCPAVLMSMVEDDKVQKKFQLLSFHVKMTERLFSLVIKTKVVHNVNRLSES